MKNSTGLCLVSTVYRFSHLTNLSHKYCIEKRFSINCANITNNFSRKSSCYTSITWKNSRVTDGSRPPFVFLQFLLLWLFTNSSTHDFRCNIWHLIKHSNRVTVLCCVWLRCWKNRFFRMQSTWVKNDESEPRERT